MRFAFVSVALLALAHSLPPGVYGAPAVVPDHANLLATRQVSGLVATLISSITSIVQGLLGGGPIPPQLAEQLEQQIAQALQNSAIRGAVPRAPSDSISSASLTTLFPTTTSGVLPVVTDQVGASTVSTVSGVSLSTSQVSSTPRARMRRQVPSALPTSVLSDVLSIVGSLSASLPVQSAPPAVPTGTPPTGTPGPVTPSPATSAPTPSSTNVSTTQV